MNSIFVPKSIKCQSNILDEEIRAFYSLHPVNASNSDYDFNTQLDRIITEYMETQSFKTANARRCFKKQLKKMILVDKPNNSKKYDNFLSWRLKQIAIHKSKQRDNVIKTIENQDLSERFNELSKRYTEQNNELYALMKENQELTESNLRLKEKLKKYESESNGSIIDIQPEKEIIIEEVKQQGEPSAEEISYDDCEESSDEESSDEEEENIYNITPEKKEQVEEIIMEVKEVKEVKPEPKEKETLIIKTKNTLFQQYADMETDGDRVDHYWEKMDEVIEEIEKFFIKNCNREKDKITDIMNVFYTFHEDEFENITESSDELYEDVFSDTYKKLNDRPFSILRDNLNQEAK